MVDHRWQRLSPADAADLLAGFPQPWWIAGGWAIDLFLGKATRQHRDMDIAMLRGAEPALRAHFRSWDIRIAHDGAFEPWTGGALPPRRHQFWARPRKDGPWALELLLEDHAGGTWQFRRDASVTLPVRRLTRTTRQGVPYLCPEVVLLYKAKFAEEGRNAADFAVTAPALDAAARRWLHVTLGQTYRGHPWLGQLK